MMRLGQAMRGLPVVAALLLGGCLGLAPNETAQVYVLTPKTTFDPGRPPVGWQMLVEEPLAQAGFDSARIAVRKSPIELDYLADATWSDTAPAMVQDLLVDSFDSSDRIQAVSPDALGLRADYTLKSEIRAFQAEFPYGYEDRTDAVARVRIAVRIARTVDREIVASETFEAEARITEGGTPGIVAAFDAALGKVLRDVVQYALELPTPANPY